jgi:FkbM family methyltransferase
MGVSYAFGRGTYNFAFLKSKVKRGMTVYDIGANAGQVALFFSKVVGAEGSVFAFEPIAKNIALLRQNLTVNCITNVSLHCLALSDSSGQTGFWFDEQRPTKGRFSELVSPSTTESENILAVETRTLDAFTEAGNSLPDLLKIDVEGGAGKVLRGAGKLLAEKGPAIYVELHGEPEAKTTAEELIARGYVIESLEEVRYPDCENAATWWCYKGDFNERNAQR